jgi:hypothetical protein
MVAALGLRRLVRLVSTDHDHGGQKRRIERNFMLAYIDEYVEC